MEGVRVSQRDAQDFIRQQSVAQVFQPPPRSTGKVVATEENAKWQIETVNSLADDALQTEMDFNAEELASKGGIEKFI